MLPLRFKPLEAVWEPPGIPPLAVDSSSPPSLLLFRPFCTLPKNLLNIAPKRPNWDLKRDLDRITKKLQPQTDEAIKSIIRVSTLSLPLASPSAVQFPSC